MNQPVLVYADDMNYYYCKYNRLSYRAYRLYKEFLIASFLPFWDFLTTHIGIVKVKPEHLPPDLGISKNNFEMPCFGSRQIKRASEFDQLFRQMQNLDKLSNRFKDDFLKLCFFDIWVANEDRSHNNYNLLVTDKSGQYDLYPIDHEACFNHGELINPIIPITYEESLICSDAFYKLFRPIELTSHEEVLNLKQKYYLCAQRCKKAVMQILEEIPEQWNIHKDVEFDNLMKYLFSESWFSNAWSVFKTYIAYFLNKNE